MNWRALSNKICSRIFSRSCRAFNTLLCNEPARQVGGDFYDVFRLDENRVGVVIADVSDKGMPAALFMALTRSLVRAEAQREMSPERVLRRVHRLLARCRRADPIRDPVSMVSLTI